MDPAFRVSETRNGERGCFTAFVANSEAMISASGRRSSASHVCNTSRTNRRTWRTAAGVPTNTRSKESHGEPPSELVGMDRSGQVNTSECRPHSCFAAASSFHIVSSSSAPSMFPPSQSNATISPNRRTGAPRRTAPSMIEPIADSNVSPIGPFVAHECFERVQRVERPVLPRAVQRVGHEAFGDQRRVQCRPVRRGGDNDCGSALAEARRQGTPQLLRSVPHLGHCRWRADTRLLPICPSAQTTAGGLGVREAGYTSRTTNGRRRRGGVRCVKCGCAM